MDLFTREEKKRLRRLAFIMKANGSQILRAVSGKTKEMSGASFRNRVEAVELSLNEARKDIPDIIKRLRAPLPEIKNNWP